MTKKALRGLFVLFSASALIGASWSPLRPAPGQPLVDRFGSPVVFVSLPAPSVRPGPSTLKQSVAIRADAKGANRLSAGAAPYLKNLRFGKHKNYERLVFDFSQRLDFWYWTMPQRDTLTIEFPQIQPFDNKLSKRIKSRLVSDTRFAANDNGKGGKFAIGLVEGSRLKRIFLLPPGKSGNYRLVVDIATTIPEPVPSNGTGMAWGGGDSLDKIGPVLLAKLYGKPGSAVADKKPEPANEAVKKTAESTGSAEMKSSPAVMRTALKDSTFDPLWPQPVDDKNRKQQARKLSEAVKELIVRHPRIKAARSDLEAARQTMMAVNKSWAPTLDVTAFYGHERQNKDEGAADTNMPVTEIDLSLKHLVSDFGATEAGEEQAELAMAQAEVILDATIRSIVLEALAAHYQLASARQAVRYARLSEQNIKRQTALEDARVRRGAGLATDALQAKAQLAGAQARRVQSQGDLAAARYRYQSVFGALPDKQVDVLTLPVPDKALPATLAAGVDAALKNNPQLEVGRLISEVARVETRRLKSDSLYPKLNLIAEAKWKENVSGTVGFQGEQIVRLEMTFPFNTGGVAFDQINASKQAYLASSQRLVEARNQVREQVQVAWQQYRTAGAAVQQLRIQADLAAEFLGLARKERKLGKRSLIEVLSGETALANARADAVTAQNDLAVAAWTLLSTMGSLNPDSVI